MKTVINRTVFAKRLKQLMREKEQTVYTLAELTHLSAPTISRYTSGEMAPKITTIEAIARHFRVNPLWLLGEDAPENLLDQSVGPELDLSAGEMEHVRLYRSLDKHGKEVVDTILKLECKRKKGQKSSKIQEQNVPSNGKESKGVISLPLALQSVSAGTGVYLNDHYTEKIVLPENEITRMAKVGIRVSGDSMEPVFRDGDILLIHAQTKIEHGEIGIFALNGEGFVKQLYLKNGECRLVSLNLNYEDIVISEFDELVCLGKVIGKI